MADAAAAPPPPQAAPPAERQETFGTSLDFGVRGVPSLRQSAGLIYEERLPLLQGGRAMRLYREMADNCPVTGFILRAMKTWILTSEYSVKPASEDPQAHQAAWLLESAMQDMSHTWDDFILQTLTCIEFGYSMFEVCYKRRLGQGDNPITCSRYNDGYVGWRKFALRSQDTLDRWQFSPYGELQGMWQKFPDGANYMLPGVSLSTGGAARAGYPGRFFIPLQKALLFRIAGYNDNPEGKSILRNAITSYLDKRRIGDIEMIGAERDLVGLPDIQLPAEYFSSRATDWMKQQVNRWADVGSLLRQDELACLVRPCKLDSENKPTGFDFGLVSSGGEKQMDIDKIIRRKEARILVSTLTDFALVGIEQGGGFDGGGVVDAKKDAFSLSLSALPRMLVSVLNHHAVQPLMRINGIPQRFWPELECSNVAGPTMAEMADYVQKLSASGMLMYDAATEHRLRQVGDLPQRDGTEPVKPSNQGMAQPQQQSPADEAAASRIPQGQPNSGIGRP